MRRALLFLMILLTLPPLPVISKETTDVYTHVDTEERIVALTFDDGPHPRYTPMILDILAEYDAKATFFVIGKNLEEYGEVAKRVVREGHEIGNHTYSHPTLHGVSKGELMREILVTESLIEETIGTPPSVFRPPEGYCPDGIKAVASENGFSVILWDIDTRDWAGGNSHDIAEHVMKKTVPGSIILFHDYIAKNSPTPAVLKEILPRLTAAGYRFVTVSELLSHATDTVESEP
ncbi:MAG: polysaccharide deacetylase family protein [Clostridia bacterium]|nr:polysaccharide deacetylase family protein [Clostridia bacterium]